MERHFLPSPMHTNIGENMPTLEKDDCHVEGVSRSCVVQPPPSSIPVPQNPTPSSIAVRKSLPSANVIYNTHPSPPSPPVTRMKKRMREATPTTSPSLHSPEILKSSGQQQSFIISPPSTTRTLNTTDTLSPPPPPPVITSLFTNHQAEVNIPTQNRFHLLSNDEQDDVNEF